MDGPPPADIRAVLTVPAIVVIVARTLRLDTEDRRPVRAAYVLFLKRAEELGVMIMSSIRRT